MNDYGPSNDRARRSYDPIRSGRSTRLRVVLSDDHRLIHQTMWTMPESDDRIEVAADADDDRESLEIADRLIVSTKTVEAHKAHIMAKRKAQIKTALITHAIRQGGISLDDAVLASSQTPP